MDPARWRRSDVLLVRHGESQNNCAADLVRARFGASLSAEAFEEELAKLHDPDCGLSPRGECQTEALRDYLSGNGFRVSSGSIDREPAKYRLFCSPMRRCLLTTRGISSALGNAPVFVHPKLFESDGCFEHLADGSTCGLPGMTAAQIESQFEGFRCLPGMEHGWYARPEKETSLEFSDRCSELADWLWEMHADQSTEDGPMVIATHGNLMRCLISKLVGASLMITHCNTGIAHIQLWSDASASRRLASLQYSNRVDHLLHAPHLIAGAEVFDDHWIQEFP